LILTNKDTRRRRRIRRRPIKIRGLFYQ